MGYLTDPEMRRLHYKISILHDFCQNSRLFASVGFTIDRVTIQHTPNCLEICSDCKVSHICLSNLTQIFCNLGYNFENSVISEL